MTKMNTVQSGVTATLYNEGKKNALFIVELCGRGLVRAEETGCGRVQKKSAPKRNALYYPCYMIKLFQPYLNAGILSKRRYDKEYP